MRTQKKVRTASANLTAKKAGENTFARDVDEDGMTRIISDLNISYQQLGVLPRNAQIPQERQE